MEEGPCGLLLEPALHQRALVMIDPSCGHTTFMVALGNGHRGIGIWMWCLNRWDPAFCGIPEPLNVPAELTLLPVPQ